MIRITKTVFILHLLKEVDVRYQFLCMHQDNSNWGDQVSRKNIDDLFMLSNLFQGISQCMIQDGKNFHQVDLYDLFKDFKAYFCDQFDKGQDGVFYLEQDDVYKFVFFLIFVKEMFELLGMDESPVTKGFHKGSEMAIKHIGYEVEGISELGALDLFQRGYL